MKIYSLLSFVLLLLLIVSMTVKSFEIKKENIINFEQQQLGSFDQSSSDSGSVEPDGCKGYSNPHEIFTDEPIFISQIDNGKLYKTGPADNQVKILHLYGEPFDMGLAHGTLLKQDIQSLIPVFMEFADVAVKEFIKSKFASRLPAFLIQLIEEFGVNAALDYVAEATLPFTPEHFFQELKGLSIGSGIDYTTLLRMHMFPELLKATCSIVGAWDKATIEGNLLQVRALDWGLENPLVNYPTMIVYHPEKGDGAEYSILSWASFIGALTGYSQRTGVCEKVWLSYNGTYTHQGMPFYFILRDILQYDNSIYEALNRLYSTPKTCAVYLGIGSNESNTVSLVEVAMSTVRVFDDQTPFPGFAPPSPQHPLMKDLVYIDKHSQPSSDPCFANSLNQTYSKISVSTLVDTIGKMTTGDLHAAIYDYKANNVYVSVATTSVPFPFNNQTILEVLPAYKNQFIQMDMTQLFAVQRPPGSSSSSDSSMDSSLN